jgi:AraC family transcriptional regulator
MPPVSLRFDVNRYAPGLRHRPHAHDELHISVVLRGGVRESVAGEEEYGEALSVVVKDPGLDHADEFSPSGALLARLSIHGTPLSDLVEHADRADSWRWTHDTAVAAPFLRIVDRGRRGRSFFPTDDNDVVDLLAALSARPGPPPNGEPPGWLRDATDTIEHAWRPGLGSRDLARAAGVHPVYLARCVRRWHGVSVGDLLRHARLRRAAHAVATGHFTVSSVAHSLGFSDEAHLCRDFSRATGIAPGRLRRLVRECDATRRACGAA